MKLKLTWKRFYFGALLLMICVILFVILLGVVTQTHVSKHGLYDSYVLRQEMTYEVTYSILDPNEEPNEDAIRAIAEQCFIDINHDFKEISPYGSFQLISHKVRFPDSERFIIFFTYQTTQQRMSEYQLSKWITGESLDTFEMELIKANRPLEDAFIEIKNQLTTRLLQQYIVNETESRGRGSSHKIR